MSTQEVEGYKNHHAGSAKGRIHKVFDKQGEAAADTLGKKLKIKDSTMYQWKRLWKLEKSGGKSSKASAKSSKRDDARDASNAKKSKSSKSSKSSEGKKKKSA